MVRNYLVRWMIVALLGVAAGCSGGGGGGSSGSSSNGSSSGGSSGTTPPASGNLQSVSTPPQPWSIVSTRLTATDNSGNSYLLTVATTASATEMFDGQEANTSILSLTLLENNVLAETEETTAYYLTDPYAPLGLSGSAGGIGWTAVVTSYTPFPATLTVGTSGAVLSGIYENSGGTNIGSLTETYSVTSESATALEVSLDSTGTINGSPVAETLTYSITNTGAAPTLAGVQLTFDGQTLNFQ